MTRWHFILGAAFVCLLPPCAHAHELPDGQVERAIQVDVWPDRIEVEYRFGMSEATMREALQQQDKSPAVNLDELEAQLLEEMSQVIPQQFVVRWQDEVIARPSVTSELIYQHHLQCASRFVYPLSINAEGRVVIEDRNWQQWPGYYRAAIRGRDNMKLSQSNAPPILVRSERIAVQPTAIGQESIVRIEALVGSGADGKQLSQNTPTESKDLPFDKPRQMNSRPLPRTLVLAVVLLIVLITIPILFLGRRQKA